MATTRLGPDEILDAAGEIVDAAGIESLSVNAVAEVLRTTPSALYNHVEGLDGIRHGLALRGTSDLTESLRDAAIGRAGYDALRAIAVAYRKYAEDHPGLYAAALLPPEGEDEDRREADRHIVDLIARVLGSLGLEGEQAVHAARAVRSAVHGFVALEATNGFARPEDVDESFTQLLVLLAAGLSAWDASK